ncbi:hypothetical protein, partial [Hymenobacter jeongseonensis]|uniref:hypothetical protein n=1 Tax=Hymenobacter jeongseonensis TaxID=2791027 RepID=UPI001E414194
MKNSSYLCTPKSKEGKRRREDYWPIGHTVRLIGAGARSLNVWKRQIVRVVRRKENHNHYKR